MTIVMDPAHSRQLLRAPTCLRTALLPSTRPQARTFAQLAPSLPRPRYISLPRIIQPSFWASMVPKPFRNRSEHVRPSEWNPATPYIVLGLLVGSQAIQIIWLKQERGHNLRRTEAKIGLIKEVIERVQRGEDVPVETMLGAGNPESEKEWVQVLKDLQNGDVLFESKKKRKALRQAAAEEAALEQEVNAKAENSAGSNAKVKVESLNGVRFY